jgi:hypothetical protein
MRAHQTIVAALLLGLPSPVPAIPVPVGISVESTLSAAPGGAAPRLGLVASCWLDGDLEGEARLAFGSAHRPGGRGADGVTPGLGLRWGPDVGRWRPLLGVEAGVRLPLAGLGAAPTAAARAGVELRVRRRLAVSLAGGWRWSSGAAPGAEATLGLAWGP